MKPLNKIWIDGKVVDLNRLNIPFFNQGLNYGACVYEGIRFYETNNGPAIFRLQEHLKRFLYSASVLNMKLNLKEATLTNGIRAIIKANKLRAGYIRPMAFYSESKMGINIFDSTITVIILVWPWRQEAVSKEVTMQVSKYKRLDPDSVDLKAKISGYYANGLLGLIEARNGGYDEPLFLDKNGHLAEGAVNNIFLVKGKNLYTPKPNNILGGITRDTIISITKDLGLKVSEKDILQKEFKKVDEVFLTGTGIEIKIVKKIKNLFLKKSYASPTSNKIAEYYRTIVQGKIAKYKKWLTYV